MCGTWPCLALLTLAFYRVAATDLSHCPVPNGGQAGQEVTSVLQVAAFVDFRQRPVNSSATNGAIKEANISTSHQAGGGIHKPSPQWWAAPLLIANDSVLEAAKHLSALAGEVYYDTVNHLSLETVETDSSSSVLFAFFAIVGVCIGLYVILRDRRGLFMFGTTNQPAPTSRPIGGHVQKKSASPMGTRSPLPNRAALAAGAAKRRGRGASPAPSPRTLAKLERPQLLEDRRSVLSDPGIWLNREPAHFVVQSAQILDVADPEATACGGNSSINIDRAGPTGAPAGTVYVAVVQPLDGLPRALALCQPDDIGYPLCSCAPTETFGSAPLGMCIGVELRDSHGKIWGSLAPYGVETYTVLQPGGREVLTVEGDQVAGRLVAKEGDQVVAHAAMDAEGRQLEVGIKPKTDPLLVMAVVLAVLIFNPEDPRRSAAASMGRSLGSI